MDFTLAELERLDCAMSFEYVRLVELLNDATRGGVSQDIVKRYAEVVDSVDSLHRKICNEIDNRHTEIE